MRQEYPGKKKIILFVNEGEDILKTKKQLQILHKIRKEVVKLKQMCDKYQQYLADNLIIINSKEKLEKLRECETKLANITLAILDSKSTFSEGRDLWNDLKDYSNKKINVPTKLKRYSKKEIEDVTIIDVLRRSRNWEEHPQKTNQILYRLMADELDFQILLELLYKVDKLSAYEINALSEEELRLMLVNSESLHSQIYTLQNEFDKIKGDILKREDITDQQKKIFQDFLNFIPKEENIVLLDGENKEDN